MEGHMRLVLYPAAVGWILFGIWLLTLRFRIRKIEYQKINTDHN
jgi:heme exporter protein C